jgi:hypothetical protein
MEHEPPGWGAGMTVLFVMAMACLFVALMYCVDAHAATGMSGREYTSLRTKQPWEVFDRLSCTVQKEYTEQTMIFSGHGKVNGGWMSFEEHDTTGDNKSNVVLWGSVSARYPHTYYFDLSGDGKPDLKFIDELQDGSCDGLRQIGTDDKDKES